MIYSTREIEQLVSPIAEKYHLKSVYLFGSYARGSATEHSDIDLLVDTTDTNIKSLLHLSALSCDLEEALQKSVDLVPMSSFEQQPQIAGERFFRRNVMRERVEIYAAG